MRSRARYVPYPARAGQAHLLRPAKLGRTFCVPRLLGLQTVPSWERLLAGPVLERNGHMKAILLAAGYATRLEPLTKTVAKPLLPLAGRPMVDYIYDRI